MYCTNRFEMRQENIWQTSWKYSNSDMTVNRLFFFLQRGVWVECLDECGGTLGGCFFFFPPSEVVKSNAPRSAVHYLFSALYRWSVIY